MNTEILVSAERLQQLISSGSCLPVDCRFDFLATKKGRNDWLAGHIPGAQHAHLDNDLAAPISAGSGRHPLPDTSAFAQFLASLGWTEGQLLVAYDSGSGALASRLWWMMRYYGQASAILDGGLAAWTKAGFSLQSGAGEARVVVAPNLQANAAMTVSTEQIMLNLKSSEFIVLDARATERFSGENETLDTSAGHIPGAINRPMDLNLDERGVFKNANALRREFESLLGKTATAPIVHSCGSGVTA